MTQDCGNPECEGCYPSGDIESSSVARRVAIQTGGHYYEIRFTPEALAAFEHARAKLDASSAALAKSSREREQRFAESRLDRNQRRARRRRLRKAGGVA